MPDYKVTLPDGRSFKVTAPEGTSMDQIRAKIKAQFDGTGATPEARSCLKKGATPDASDPGAALNLELRLKPKSQEQHKVIYTKYSKH